MDWREYSARMALRLAPVVLCLVSFAAILIGLIFHAVSIDEVEYSSPPASHFDPAIIIDNKFDNLIWFLQVSDLHLSSRSDFERTTDFAEFAKTYLDIIKPDAVLVTGDITDGRTPDTLFRSGPQLAEWQAYAGAVEKADAINRTLWLDVRGNHDNFNVYRPSEATNLYRRYSVQGKNHARNYISILKKGDQNYSFIGVDEVQTPGLKIPFNFLGIVKDDDLKELESFREKSKECNSQYTVWFAHYPTSSIVSPHEALRKIVDGPYLCGHYHTIGNWVRKMHATQQPGFAELELGDWKSNRRIRLAAVDHQLFSATDVAFKEFPVALMTNPKPPEQAMPKYEPLSRILNSTHMRVIAFSDVPMGKDGHVRLSIDRGAKKKLDYVDGPLYVGEWQPEDYSTGLHEVEITVTDSAGKTKSYIQTFSLDNSKPEFSLAARILLRLYFRTSILSMFTFILVICTLPLLILRLIAFKNNDSGFRRHYRGTLLYNLHLLSNVGKLFWPLFLVPLYLAIGPNFIAYMVDEALGVCFAWGVWIDGNFVHTGLTYVFDANFLLLVHLPVLVNLTSQVGVVYKSTLCTDAHTSVFNYRLLIHIALTALQILMSSTLFSAYGALGYFSSFPFFWCIFIYAYCWYQCANISKDSFSRLQNSKSPEEQQALTGQGLQRDDKSNSSDRSTC